MGGIRRVNIKQINLAGTQNVSATVPPHAPGDTDVVVARYVAPSAGRVSALSICVAVPGTPGTGAGHKQMLRVRNAGFAGTGTDVITDDVVIKDLTPVPDDLPAAGTVRVAAGQNVAKNNVQRGEILEVFHEATGTIGTGAAAAFSIVGLLFDAAAHVDPTV